MRRLILTALIAVLAATGVATGHQADTPTGFAPHQERLWESIDPVPAGPRARALHRSVAAYMRRQGVPVPTGRHIYTATSREGWEEALPPSSAGVATPAGMVYSPEFGRDVERQWPPTIDHIRLVAHEEVHPIEDTVAGAYGGWDLTTRAAAEARAQLVAEVIADGYMRSHFPRVLAYSPMFASYADCTEVLRRAISRATGWHRYHRRHRSFTLALTRAPITTTRGLMEEHLSARELQRCRRDAAQPAIDRDIYPNP